jgi:hypothetical protein
MVKKEGMEQQTPKIQHVDLPEVSETFADSIDLVFFDGQTLRINTSPCGGMSALRR